MKLKLPVISFFALLLTAFVFPVPAAAFEGTFTASDYSFDPSTNTVHFTADNFNPPRDENTGEINDFAISLYNTNGQLVLDYFNYVIGSCFNGNLPNSTTVFHNTLCYNEFWHADLPLDDSPVYLRIAQSASGNYRSQPIPANELLTTIPSPTPTPSTPPPGEGTFTASNFNFDSATQVLSFTASNFNPPRTTSTDVVNDFAIALYNSLGHLVLDYYNYNIPGCFEGNLPNLTTVFSHKVCYNEFWHADYPANGASVVLRIANGSSGNYHSQKIPADQLQTTSATFNAVADTYLKSGTPNRNLGGGVFMRLQPSGDNRSLVRFDQAALQSTIGTNQVKSAKLRLTISEGGTGWGTTGRTIDLHRLTADWSEGNGTESDNGTGSGVTWACAIDSIISNVSKNCSGVTEWEMGQPNNPSVHPWVETPSATQTINNNQSGVVEFDVTSDVDAFVNGSNQNYGWLIKKTNEALAGNVSFGTKESSTVPQLVVTY